MKPGDIERRLARREALLRRRFETLRRGPPSVSTPPPVSDPPALPPSVPTPDPFEQLRALRRAVSGEPAPASTRPTAVERLSEIMGGAERHTPHGDCYVVDLTLGSDHRHGERAVGAVLGRALGAGTLTGDKALRDFDVRRALFLDLETTGLARGMGTLAFLVGTAHFQDDRLVLEQWLLREPEEEPAALYDLQRRLEGVEHLVTYNGRSFDLPLLRTRCFANRMKDPSRHLGHLDLLHPARKLLASGLPNCRLSTIEAHRLGVRRVDDVPGSEAPTRYHAYLHGDAPDPLGAVVAHNRDDVLSMVVLLDLLLERCEEIDPRGEPEAALCLAKHAVNTGEWAYAERIYEAVAHIPGMETVGAKGLAQLATRRPREPS